MSTTIQALVVRGGWGVEGKAKETGPFLLEKPPNMVREVPNALRRSPISDKLSP